MNLTIPEKLARTCSTRPDRREWLSRLPEVVAELQARWSLSLADLRSRLVAAQAVAIGPPDDGLIAALLIKLFDDRQLRVSDGVVEFLLARMERSFEAARRLVTALDEAALANRRNITVPLARQVLDDLDNRQ